MILDNILNVKEFLLTKRMLVDVDVCYHCNYDCDYCGNRTLITKKHERCIDIDGLVRKLDELNKIRPNELHILLSGGEPTLHPQLFDLLEKLKSFPKIKISLFTNLSQTTVYYKHILDYGVDIYASFHISQTDWKSFYEFSNKVGVKAIFVPLDVRHSFDWLDEYISNDNRIKPQIIWNRDFGYKRNLPLYQKTIYELNANIKLFNSKIRHLGSNVCNFHKYYCYIDEFGTIIFPCINEHRTNIKKDKSGNVYNVTCSFPNCERTKLII